jgi:hypothetical protein
MEDTSVALALISAAGAIVVAFINKPRPAHQPAVAPSARTVGKKGKVHVEETPVQEPPVLNASNVKLFDKIVLIFSIISSIIVVVSCLMIDSEAADTLITIILLLLFMNGMLFLYLLVRIIIDRFRKRINNISAIVCALSCYIIYLILS